jgi:hypothetical protein
MEINYTRLLYIVLAIVAFAVVVWYKRRWEKKNPKVK